MELATARLPGFDCLSEPTTEPRAGGARGSRRAAGGWMRVGNAGGT